MPSSIKKILHTLILAFFFLASPLHAQELRILTSFPPALTNVYAALFEKDKSNVSLQVLNKNTIAAIDEVMRGNERKFDIFWSSSPEAFEILRRNGAFADKHICGSSVASSVEPFALSSVGWARRRDSDVFMPANWNDLLKPYYRGKIAMARPARSGSTHLIVENLLLNRGWDDGWAYLLEMSANLSTLTARSFGVPDGLLNERFDIGLTIDFLSQSHGEDLQFRYGNPLMLVPAQIGILKTGENTQNACAFLQQVLSKQGQRALLFKQISRIPYNKAIREEFAATLPKDINNALKLMWLEYDAGITSNRYWAVNVLFDLMITERLNERRELWRRYHALKLKISSVELNMIKQLLTKVVVPEASAAAASGMTKMGLRSTALVSLGADERDIVQGWRSRVSAQLQEADQALSRIEKRTGP